MKKLTDILRTFKILPYKILSHKISLLAVFLVAILMKKYLKLNSAAQKIIRISLSDFLKQLNEGVVKKAFVRQTSISFVDKNNCLYKTTHNLFPKSQLFSKLINKNVQFQDLSSGFQFTSFFFALFLSAAITFVISIIFSNNSSLKMNNSAKSTSTFKDIVGLDDCKIALLQVIEFMKNPLSFKDFGARMRKGIIFYGPSGTGKTSLAKACAGEAEVPFFSCNAAQFREIYVGMGAKKVRQLFKKARQSAPSIIYIDEIDAMGNRSVGNLMGGFESANSQKNATINQLLSEMDGFQSSEMILVIGSTNKLQFLDQSLLRPGRFDLKLKVNLPNEANRFQIFKHYLQNKKHKLSQKYIKDLTLKLKGWSGADLQNLSNQAVYTSLRRKVVQIQEQDIENALRRLQ